VQRYSKCVCVGLHACVRVFELAAVRSLRLGVWGIMPSIPSLELFTLPSTTAHTHTHTHHSGDGVQRYLYDVCVCVLVQVCAVVLGRVNSSNEGMEGIMPQTPSLNDLTAAGSYPLPWLDRSTSTLLALSSHTRLQTHC
jgi:hypothetical protein